MLAARPVPRGRGSSAISNTYDPYHEADEGAEGLDVAWLLSVVRRRRKSFLVAFGVALIPALIAPFFAQSSYEAVAKVAVEETPDVLHFGEEFMPRATRPYARSQLSPVIGIVMSDRLLGRVVDRMRIGDDEAAPGLLERGLSALGFERKREAFPPEAERQLRIERLRKAIELDETAGGTILQITATASDASLSSWIANNVAEVFVQYQAEQRRVASETAIRWLSQKASELREQIRRRDEALSSLSSRLDVVPREDGPSSQKDRAQLFAELRQAELDLLAVEEQYATLAPRVRAYRQGEANPEIAQLQERYVAAKKKLETDRMRYRESHPEVQRLVAVVGELERQLGPDLARAPDPEGPDKLREFQLLEAKRLNLRARVDVLRKALEDLTAADADTAEAMAEYERMERENTIDRQMLEVIMQRTNQTLVNAASAAPPARVLDHAVQPLQPATSQRKKLLVLGVGFALALGLGVGALRELLDRTVYDPEQVATMLGVPLLSSIPLVTNGSSAERMSSIERATPASESVRNLRTSILFASGRLSLRSLLVASAVAGEGKTTVAMNLAASFGQTGRKVLLLDADLRRPRVNKVLALPREPGLTEVLRDGVDPVEVIQRPVGFGFDVITSGEIPLNSVDLIGSQRLDELFEVLTARYDLLLIDAPVLLSVADTLLLAARADALLLVSKPGSVDQRAYSRIRGDLERAEARLIGVVSNQVDVRSPYEYPDYLDSPYVENDRKKRRGRWGSQTGRS